MWNHKQKYIVTKDNAIIVFSDLFQHSDFRSHGPISAGFISIGATDKHKPTIECYGESISLNLKSREEEDTALARKQILGSFDY
jgi:hypothetical protein